MFSSNLERPDRRKHSLLERNSYFGLNAQLVFCAAVRRTVALPTEVEVMGFLNRFLRSAEQRLAGLPLPCAVRLAGGPRIGSSQPHVVFVVRDTIALVHLAHGAIGRLAEDYVEGRLEIEGEMRDLMAIAPALLGVDPALESGGWLPRLVRRTQRLLWSARITAAPTIPDRFGITTTSRTTSTDYGLTRGACTHAPTSPTQL